MVKYHNVTKQQKDFFLFLICSHTHNQDYNREVHHNGQWTLQPVHNSAHEIF